MIFLPTHLAEYYQGVAAQQRGILKQVITTNKLLESPILSLNEAIRSLTLHRFSRVAVGVDNAETKLCTDFIARRLAQQ